MQYSLKLPVLILDTPSSCLVSRVADQDTERDPAFFLIADPDPGFDDLKLKKCTAGNLFLFS
jgi:hypothetical protein